MLTLNNISVESATKSNELAIGKEIRFCGNVTTLKLILRFIKKLQFRVKSFSF